MTKKVTGYTIMVTENSGNRRSYGRYYKKVNAKKELNKLLSPGKIRKYNGKKIYLTSYRDAKTGSGFNNPRIKKVKIFK